MKINVLHIIHGFIQGGSEAQMIQLMKLLRNSGNFNIHVACLDAGGELRQQVDEMNFDEIPEFPLTSFYDRNMLTQLKRFVAHLRARKIEIIHTHDFYSNIFGITGSRLANINSRIASKRETLGLRSPAQTRLELLVFKLANAIVVNAEAVRAHLLKAGVAETKTIVIHNGLDLDRFKLDSDPSDRRHLLSTLLPEDLINDQVRVITMVAGMHHDVKNYPMFLRAARRVVDVFPTAVFLLVGDGTLINSLRQLAAELGISRQALMLGHRSNVPDILCASDACVLSSKAEGFSNSILEYMAAGKPVVATNVGGAREAIAEGETGFLIESDDDSSMAARLIDLLQNPELAREMGSRGRKVVEEKFSSVAQLRRTEDLYAKLVRRSTN